MTRKNIAWSLCTVLIAAGAFIAGSATAKVTLKPEMLPVANAKWTNLMGDGGPALASLWGDPMKGASGYLLKLPAGFESPMHSHSNTYWSVVVSGTMKHWVEGQTEADAPALLAGSYAMMPGKLNHISKCLPGAECVIFATQKGKFDFKPAKTPMPNK